MSALQIVDQWLHVPTLKLRAGEMTAQELRTVKAVLNGLRAELVTELAANATAQDVGYRYEALDEARKLVLDEALGWCEQRRGDEDGRISQALGDAAEKIRVRMVAPPAPAAPGFNEPEPPLELPGGKTNFAWIKWNRAKTGRTLRECEAAWLGRVDRLRMIEKRNAAPAAGPAEPG